MKSYKERLRELREDTDKKQIDLANLLHCAQTCYSKWELGQRDIPTKVLMQLAEYYETSTDYILGLTNERKPYPRA